MRTATVQVAGRRQNLRQPAGAAALPVLPLARTRPTVEALEPIRTALAVLEHRAIPVVGTDYRLDGMIEPRALLAFVIGAGYFSEFNEHPRKMDLPVKHLMSQANPLPANSTVRGVLERVWTTGKQSFPLVQDGKLAGLAELIDLIPHLELPDLPASAVMTPKPLVVSESLRLRDAAAQFIYTGYHRFPVVENKVLVGMLTATGVLKHVENGQLRGRVSDAMARGLVTVLPDAPLSEVAKLVRKHGSAPITEDGILLGLITPTDLAEVSLTHLAHPITQRVPPSWTQAWPASKSKREVWPDPERRNHAPKSRARQSRRRRNR